VQHSDTDAIKKPSQATNVVAPSWSCKEAHSAAVGAIAIRTQVHFPTRRFSNEAGEMPRRQSYELTRPSALVEWKVMLCTAWFRFLLIIKYSIDTIVRLLRVLGRTD
jgi:phosphopantetheinyl transferase (holo-ACP synthase)